MYKAKAEPINTSTRLVESAIPVLTFVLLACFIWLPFDALWPDFVFGTYFVFGTNFHFPKKLTSPSPIVALSLSNPSNIQVPSFTLTSNLEGLVGETLVPFSTASWFAGIRSKTSFGKDLPGVVDSNL